MPYVPRLGAHQRKTYQLNRPLATHWRSATCEEADCHHLLWGFVVRVDESTDQGREQARYLRTQPRGSNYSVVYEASGLTAFHYPPGTQPFAGCEHKLPVERDPLYLVKGGDKRGNPRGTPTRQLREEQWVDDFATHQDHLADRMRQG